MPLNSIHDRIRAETSEAHPLRVNVIGKSNGVGLARDMKLLRDALCAIGCEVTELAIDKKGSRVRRSFLVQCGVRIMRRFAPRLRQRADVNLMLEHVWMQHLPFARFNVAIPNPEWFDRRDCRFLGQIDHVWAKTRYTQQVFQAKGASASFVGFDSEDRYDPTVPRRRSYFHLAGKSVTKGTDRLLRVWSRHPEWPPLTVVAHSPRESWHRAANIHIMTGYVSDEQLRAWQNENIFHLCPSIAEGWGHYIVEAMSVGAVTITTAAPPMNELVSEERGILVAARPAAPQCLSTTHQVDEAALEAAIERTFEMSDEECASVGERARSWFLQNKRGFPERLRAALHALQLAPVPHVGNPVLEKNNRSIA